jgi:hypothetical protein
LPRFFGKEIQIEVIYSLYDFKPTLEQIICSRKTSFRLLFNLRKNPLFRKLFNIKRIEYDQNRLNDLLLITIQNESTVASIILEAGGQAIPIDENLCTFSYEIIKVIQS